MSTLRVNTIQNASGGSAISVPGAAKAWVNFNGTGTVAIRAQLNVSSITDNGTGNYTVNFASAMSSATYSIVGTAKTSDASTADTTIAQWNTVTTANFRLASSQGNNGVLVDPVNISAAVFN